MRTRRSQSSSDPVSEPHADQAPRGEKHRSVLLHEAIDALDIKQSDTIVDATLGGAGHAREIVKKLGRNGLFIGFDLDPDAIRRGEVALSMAEPKRVLINANFRELKKELGSRDITRIDKVLFDLGWSGYQLEAGRGFSFQKDEPLLMTYSKSAQALTAATIINEWAESSIADVLYGWGEERYSRRIAKAIVVHREKKPFTSASELAEVVRGAVPLAYRRGKLHPATKTFQGLRIAVNDELGALKEGLQSARELLNAQGRISVITFHSIEDRLVKQTFATWERETFGKRVNKKPLTPGPDELRENPRARSGKLRTFEKF